MKGQARGLGQKTLKMGIWPDVCKEIKNHFVIILLAKFPCVDLNCPATIDLITVFVFHPVQGKQWNS